MIPDRVGTLIRALQMISSGGMNIVNLRMTPATDDTGDSRVFKDWFVIDVAVHAENADFHALLGRFRENADTLIREVKLLGSYVSGWEEEFAGPQTRPKAPEEPPVDPLKFVEEIIARGESERVEFKSSLRYDYRSRSVNKDLASVVGKSICGFLNVTGGYLVIGVSDTGELLGIENDINALSKKSVDGFLSAFYQVVSDMIGKEFAQYVRAEVIELQGKLICCVRMQTSAMPAWLAEKGGYTLYLRVGNSTRPLNAKEANEYVMSRSTVR
jgi:hypothetical protein